jgi:hypothetical protein
MTQAAKDVEAYLLTLPDDRREVLSKLRGLILENLPGGFREEMSYGMIGYVVPHEMYPSGYHCNPRLPLPFMNIGSQKRHIAVYHMGLYAMPDLMDWFLTQWSLRVDGKPNMGKSCIRFGNMGRIPFDLIGELAGKVEVSQWVRCYETVVKA